MNEEVKQEGLVRSIGNFARFLEVVSFSHGCEINASGIARECAVGRRAVEGYIEILSDLLLSFTIPPFAKKAERAPRAHPKFYYFDTGVYRSVRPRGPMDRPEEIAGAALEGLVAQHLRAWSAYRGQDERLHYWRLPSGSEVDFVVYGGQTFTALEVKNADRVRGTDLRGLKAFGELYPQAQRVFLYRGPERALVDGIHCIPVERFLRSLHPARELAEAYA
jgi:predicted AAA+ superfamily ATPase